MAVLGKKAKEKESVQNDFIDVLKLIIYSCMGIFIFFIPIKSDGQSLTIIYHIAYKLQSDARGFLKVCITLYIILGCIKPIFVNRKNK